jgi:cytochrome c553
MRAWGAGLAVLSIVGIVWVGLSQPAGAIGLGRYTVEVPPIVVSQEEVVLARGRHLVEHVLACGRCHGADLGGAVWFEHAWHGTGAAPNLTPTGQAVAGYQPEDWARAVLHAVGDDGKALRHMPASWWSGLSPDDLQAIVSWLVRLPPVERAVPPHRPGAWPRVGAALWGAGYDVVEELPVQAEPVEVAPDARYGAYLARVAGCEGCHGPQGPGVASSPDAPDAPELRALRSAGWTGAQFAAAVVGGKGRDGRTLHPAMPSAFYVGLDDLEVDALWSWARGE